MNELTINTAQTNEVFEPLVNSRQAADLLHMNYKTVERWARIGELPGYQYSAGEPWYFRKSELDSWLRSKLNSVSQLHRVN
jgi:excisionase family DNA binding protein